MISKQLTNFCNDSTLYEQLSFLDTNLSPLPTQKKIHIDAKFTGKKTGNAILVIVI